MRLALVIAFLALASACSGGPAGSCDQKNCLGCCNAQGQCVSGNAADACGTGGNVCGKCSVSQSCSLGQCVGGTNTGGSGGTGGGAASGGGTGTGGGIASGGGTGTGGGTASGGGTGTGGGVSSGGGTGTGGGSATGCGPATCSGCCNGNTCELGTSTSTCGTQGQACTQCGSGLSCVGGSCQGSSSCGPSTCPTGCCSNGACVAGTSTSACGKNGATCTTCGSGLACAAQQCTAATTCGPSNCSGCCDSSGFCQAGVTNSACGLGGIACEVCLFGACGTSGVCTMGTGGGGGSSSGLPTGSPCIGDSQCASSAGSLFGASCISATSSDGGVSGWTGGYCSSFCLDLTGLGACPTAGDYCDGLFCRQGCTTPGQGRGSCRSGYVCQNDFLDDGGVVAASAHCIPNCNNAPSQLCGTRGCSTTGYCL